MHGLRSDKGRTAGRHVKRDKASGCGIIRSYRRLIIHHNIHIVVSPHRATKGVVAMHLIESITINGTEHLPNLQPQDQTLSLGDENVCPACSRRRNDDMTIYPDYRKLDYGTLLIGS